MSCKTAATPYFKNAGKKSRTKHLDRLLLRSSQCWIDESKIKLPLSWKVCPIHGHGTQLKVCVKPRFRFDRTRTNDAWYDTISASCVSVRPRRQYRCSRPQFLVLVRTRSSCPRMGLTTMGDRALKVASELPA